ncbi:MAG TPA: TlpA disulfide reductase family protein [Candidatus Acidoferrales bacterium]|nr:TlpA disulfide reductase family protein [Candidatus Acidoferrales bacterium]
MNRTGQERTCSARRSNSAALALAVALLAGALFGCSHANSLTSSDLSVSFNDAHGKDISLKLPCSNNCTTGALKGKVVLVNFWATWCDPCRGEIPSLIEFQKQNADKGFTLLGIAMDDDGAKVVQPFVDKTKFDVNGKQMIMNYPIVIGSDSVADKFGGLWAFPTSVLLTRDGKIAKRFIGALTPQDLQYIQGMIGS